MDYHDISSEAADALEQAIIRLVSHAAHAEQVADRDVWALVEQIAQSYLLEGDDDE